MKNLTTQVFRVNGQFDIYANEDSKRVQNYSDLATDMGRNWDDMSKRSRSNFRKRYANKLMEITTQIEVFEITAVIPVIFDKFQLKEATINHLIHPATGTIFLACKNGVTGYSTGDFQLKKIQ